VTAPSSCTPARLAVVAALTTSTGKPRALVNLYRQATPADVAQNLADLKKKPSAFVLFGDAVLDGEVENGSKITMHYVVTITRWYWMGSDLIKREVERQMARIDADTPLMRAALCATGALELDPSGNATGLAGQALRSDGWRSMGPAPLPTQAPDADRVLRCVDTFRASIDLLQPT
jgi:hypothetical protein